MTSLRADDLRRRYARCETRASGYASRMRPAAFLAADGVQDWARPMPRLSDVDADRRRFSAGPTMLASAPPADRRSATRRLVRPFTRPPARSQRSSWSHAAFRLPVFASFTSASCALRGSADVPPHLGLRWHRRRHPRRRLGALCPHPRGGLPRGRGGSQGRLRAPIRRSGTSPTATRSMSPTSGSSNSPMNSRSRSCR